MLNYFYRSKIVSFFITQIVLCGTGFAQIKGVQQPTFSTFEPVAIIDFQQNPKEKSKS
jgi:hypothetical protein